MLSSHPPNFVILSEAVTAQSKDPYKAKIPSQYKESSTSLIATIFHKL